MENYIVDYWIIKSVKGDELVIVYALGTQEKHTKF
jgi:hypothetical protein